MTKGHLLPDFTRKHLQAQPLPGRPLVEILGTERVLIENHGGICAYSLSEVIIKVRNGEIKILGEKLTLSTMSREQVVVSGVIYSIELPRRIDLCE